MRLYTFTNWYLSSIQQGIQAGHAAVELFVKYRDSDSIQHFFLYNWAEYHKTFVCLNGGNNEGISEIFNLLSSDDNDYPWAPFYEDEQSLSGILTSIAIVLPDSIYDTAAKIRSKELQIVDNNIVVDKEDLYYGELTDFQVSLIEKLNSCGLAR